MTALPSNLSDRVTVKYHYEPGGWWGEVEGWRWSCAAPTLEECREVALGGLPYGVDERLSARSIMFVHFDTQGSPITIDPDASETFQLYVAEDDE